MVSIMECGTPQSQQQQQQQQQQQPNQPITNQRFTTGPRTGGSNTGGGSLELSDDPSDVSNVDSARVKSPTSPATGSIEAFASPPTSPTSPLSQEAPSSATSTTAAATGGTAGNSEKSTKSAVSQRSIELQMSQQKATDTELAKRALKLDLVKTNKSIEEFNVKSPKSPLASSVRSGRLPHHKSLTAQVDLVEDRKTLRDTLYQGIFHRHRRTIFAVGSFLRMLRSRNSQYNTIRSSSEGEDIDETR